MRGLINKVHFVYLSLKNKAMFFPCIEGACIKSVSLCLKAWSIIETRWSYVPAKIHNIEYTICYKISVCILPYALLRSYSTS